ncbi:LutC/YkgG family protein [Pedobacter sp. SAFR-022]|uniref:LutC/YkgG family protein n=1 Tax=Pedobacter sp. SAFR-022 TaxID=3436861 RepID=UPI003F800918
MSKAEILAAIQRNKPALMELPAAFMPLQGEAQDLKELFSGMVNQVGGQVLSVEHWQEIEAYVHQHFRSDERVITTIAHLRPAFESVDPGADPHDLADVSLAILPGQFGVAENAAIWLTDDQLGIRVLPFICQHLAIVIRQDQLLANMHEAYDRIGSANQAFGVFIAGPSKTADIEQSLVIGAHGARSLFVFLLK